MPTAIVWFRRDLRLHDHRPLHAAAAAGYGIIPVYIHEPRDGAPWPAGAASCWWLHHSLQALTHQLDEHGSGLVIRRGEARTTLTALVRETGADAVYWQRRHEPSAAAQDQRIKAALRDDGVHVEDRGGALLYEPGTVRGVRGRAYRKFTPFWAACQALGAPGPPLDRPPLPVPADGLPRSQPLASLDRLPAHRWDEGLGDHWQPGEEGAARALTRFLDAALHTYAEDRDRPAVYGTSRLSPHLHFGEISPRQVHAAVWQHMEQGGPGSYRSGEKFLTELGWREFAHHVLSDNPSAPDEPLDRRFAGFPWRHDGRTLLRAWQRGQTGIPLVDAGMRELWRTGWMHNRVRMVAGSFLVKNLRLPWQHGEAWFWDTLVDADLASNSLGWQWVAGSGADAAPYFRVFNPVRQAERFDPDGEYIARWVPELANLPAAARWAPWQADAGTLRSAGVALGGNYPRPVVDLKASRAEALAAFQAIKGR